MPDENIKHIKIGMAGLSEEIELRLSLACGLLAASQIDIEIQDWQGNESDILIVDIDSGHGRLAYEMAQRRNLPVLVFPRSGDNETQYASKLDRDAPAAALARALQEKLQSSSDVSSDDVQGLLGICIREAGCNQDLLVKRGGIAMILLLVMAVVWLALLIPGLAVGVRRLHDTDRSGWWLGGYIILAIVSNVVRASTGSAGLGALLSIVTLVYAITLLVFFCLDGTFLIDLEDRVVELGPQQGFVVPKGVMHRPRAPKRTVILMVEGAGIVPTGDA